MKSPLFLFCLFFTIPWLAFPQTARAYSIGDAAITVALTTGTGAVLGLSTLPFYEDSGANKSNIFYGAAIGAVVGVGLAAYAAMQEGDEEVQTRIRQRELLEKKREYAAKFRAESSAGLGFGWKEASKDKVLLWSPLATLRF